METVTCTVDGKPVTIETGRLAKQSNGSVLVTQGKSAVLVTVIMFHAFWTRAITSSYLKRTNALKARASIWQADLLFTVMVMMLLALHLAEVVVWSAALIFGVVAPTTKIALFAIQYVSLRRRTRRSIQARLEAAA